MLGFVVELFGTLTVMVFTMLPTDLVAEEPL